MKSREPFGLTARAGGYYEQLAALVQCCEQSPPEHDSLQVVPSAQFWMQLPPEQDIEHVAPLVQFWMQSPPEQSSTLQLA